MEALRVEFKEFSEKQLGAFTDTFKKFDENNDGFLDLMELKRMLEKLGEPQTHIALKEIVRKVNNGNEEKVNLSQFVAIFSMATNQLLGGSSAARAFKNLASTINVSKVGVRGAVVFFQEKIDELSYSPSQEMHEMAEMEKKKREKNEEKEKERLLKEKKIVEACVRREEFAKLKSMFFH